MRIKWNLLSPALWLKRVANNNNTRRKLCSNDANALTNDLEEYSGLRRACGIPVDGDAHQLYILQPKLSNVELRQLQASNGDLLAEAVQLVNSVPGWRVDGVHETFVKATTSRRYLLGTGTVEAIVDAMQRHPNCTGVFVNVAKLNPLQKLTLQLALKKRILDRYLISVQIFKLFATSKEAKLQATLAEIAYLRNQVQYYTNGEMQRSFSSNLLPKNIAWKEKGAFVDRQERILKSKLKEIGTQRVKLRLNPGREKFPLVAVVGYTNCGKTSLIGQLSKGSTLKGEDRYFATLDTTVHAVRLPCSLSTLFVDTVGFFHDLPVDLLPCFNSTLEEIVNADVVLHILDRSNPNWQLQRKTVIDSLSKLVRDLCILELWNKIDKLPSADVQSLESNENVILTSCKTGRGLDQVLNAVQTSILTQTDYKRAKLEVPIGDKAISQMYKLGAVDMQTAVVNGNNLLINVVMKRYDIERLLKERPGIRIVQE